MDKQRKEIVYGEAGSESAKGADIARLLLQMGDALSSGDVATAVSLWEVPAFLIGELDVRVFNSSTELQHYFAGGLDEYNRQGIVKTQPDIVEARWVTEQVVLVDVRWPYLDARNRTIGEESSVYTVRRDQSGQWRFRAAVLRGEARSETDT